METGSPISPGAPAIDIRSLRVDYGNFLAVDDLTLTVPPGEIFGLVGPNGAGKTSTFRVLTTLIEPTYGEVILEGVDVLDDHEGARRILGYMPDLAPVPGDLKAWASGFFIWIQILLLGNALPLIEPGRLFPSQGFSGMVKQIANWTPQPVEAVFMTGTYGLVTFVLMIVLASLITPSVDHQIKGWRRARKQGRSSLPPLGDEATGFWFLLVMVLAGAAGWFLFTQALVESRWFPGHHAPAGLFVCFVAVLLAGGAGYQTLLEAKGGRVALLAGILGGIVPVMAGAVLGVVSNRMIPAAAWLVGISPLSMPFYATASLLPISELPAETSRAVPRAFFFWLFVTLVLAVWLAIRLWTTRRKMARESLTRPSAIDGNG
ncbi:MAG: ATP-binding cassette domain-containing protein [Terrimicrobiaceae bacterium]|nr:ATP-binding cassette domain-containing protein [Terrimicrobiaceae bacterium]